LARILAGVWFIAAGVATLLQFRDLVPQAGRLFGGDIGATDAPIRSLLALILAAAQLPIGLLLAGKGFGWTRRLVMPADGPPALDRDEVVATLARHELPAYADGPDQPYWPLRRWLADDIADLTWWRRDITSRGVRMFVASWGWVLAIVVACAAVPLIIGHDVLGPFPAGFVTVLLLVTATWAALVLLLIPSNHARIASVEFPLPPRPRYKGERVAGEIIESRPDMLHHEPAGVGMTLGISGVVTQCLMMAGWNLPYTGYALLATSIIRDTASIAGGIVLFVLGDRMVATAAGLLLHFRYESILVLIEGTDHGMIARAAGIRTERRGLTGSRHVIAAVGGVDVRESAERLVAR
jgi:hypothetical protein